MTSWLAATIGGATGVLGAAVGGGATYLAQRRAERGGQRDTVAAGVAAYAFALDVLCRQLAALPRQTRLAVASDKVVNADRTPGAHYLLTWVHAKTIGRDAFRALDQYSRAHHELILIAPAQLLRPLGRINELLTTADERNADWDRDMSEARGGLTAAARELVA
jgi:hypothetical protein